MTIWPRYEFLIYTHRVKMFDCFSIISMEDGVDSIFLRDFNETTDSYIFSRYGILACLQEKYFPKQIETVLKLSFRMM